MTDIVIVLTTIAESRADEVASLLVEERLAACVNVHGPMRSTYRWNEAIERDVERQLFIKTTDSQLAALESRLKTLHPYDLPELIILRPEAVEPRYAEWVRTSTRP